MSYLLTQMFLYMLCTFLLGLLLGWLLWRYGKPSSDAYGLLEKERDALRAERQDLNTNLDACRARSAKEREANERLTREIAELKGDQAAPIPAPAPVTAATPAPASSFTGTASKPQGLTAPRGGRADDLKLISGVGPKMEELLHDLGYFHFDQIAAWTPAEVAWVDDNLEGFKGRVTRDSWIAQAGNLSEIPK